MKTQEITITQEHLSAAIKARKLGLDNTSHCVVAQALRPLFPFTVSLGYKYISRAYDGRYIASVTGHEALMRSFDAELYRNCTTLLPLTATVTYIK